MTPRRLRQLADRIDDIFLDGSFAQVCSPCYAVQEARLTPSEAGDCDAKAVCHATAGFEPSSNTIMFYRPAWQHQPSLRMPVQADGVYCSNKLEWLAHTMAHEQVHCIVHHACPQTSRMQAYVANHGHVGTIAGGAGLNVGAQPAWKQQLHQPHVPNTRQIILPPCAVAL